MEEEDKDILVPNCLQWHLSDFTIFRAAFIVSDFFVVVRAVPTAPLKPCANFSLGDQRSFSAPNGSRRELFASRGDPSRSTYVWYDCRGLYPQIDKPLSFSCSSTEPGGWRRATTAEGRSGWRRGSAGEQIEAEPRREVAEARGGRDGRPIAAV